ncbi:MAG: NUDIX domain-containing protein [Ruminococcus sp.]|uniref:NAD(+) diphosphatase n=1 Tax=Ruminococcus sp. TaxID=41978 RepID=UPI0025D65F8B|nr:NUDIX domain-containing protein [Ruminococcus sp.]MBO4866998.1 NUDIX domain-containing protein [Ruminococcus sp.]
MRFEYCPFCGKKTILKEIGDEGQIPYCEDCARPLFDMFSTCVLNVVVNEDNEVLLIRQSYGDTSRYVGVAGFMKIGETPEEAGAREVLEETGLTAESVRYIDSAFYDGRDQLMLGLLARVKKADCDISGELLEAKWFTFDEAVKTVREGSIIQRFINRAKGEIV